MTVCSDFDREVPVALSTPCPSKTQPFPRSWSTHPAWKAAEELSAPALQKSPTRALSPSTTTTSTPRTTRECYCQMSSPSYSSSSSAGCETAGRVSGRRSMPCLHSLRSLLLKLGCGTVQVYLRSRYEGEILRMGGDKAARSTHTKGDAASCPSSQ